MRRQWAPSSSSPTNSLPLPSGYAPHRSQSRLHLQTRRVRRTLHKSLLCSPLRSPLRLRRASLLLLLLLLLLIVAYALRVVWHGGIPPTYEEVRAYERALPQHNLTRAVEEGTLYLRVGGQVSGRGFNNVLQETLLLSYLSYRLGRAYVFEDYTWSRMPTRYVIHAHALRPSRIPLNAFISGPTAGGPMSPSNSNSTSPSQSHPDDSAPRSVSLAFWQTICPKAQRRVISSEGQPPGGDASEILEWWIGRLGGVEDRCVEIDSRARVVFDYLVFGDKGILSIWPGFSTSPILQNFQWSRLVQSTLQANAHVLRLSTAHSPSPSHSYSHSHEHEHEDKHKVEKGLVAIHLRRGDFAGHCSHLARYGARYMGYNQFPSFPDTFDPIPPPSISITAHYQPHCLPTPSQILHKLRTVRASHPGLLLRRVYLLTNGERAWVARLAEAVREEGWEDLRSSLDLVGRGDVGVGVDMAIAERAEVFIGNGFSSLTSNVAALRMARGFDPSTTRFL